MNRAFVVGDNIDTDALAPGAYMAAGIETLTAHCLETVIVDFATRVRPGDVLIAGNNFGMGSSREQAAEALKALGIAGVVANSFAGIFYRNAINLGLSVLIAKSDTSYLTDGDAVRLDVHNARLYCQKTVVELEPLPGFLLEILDDGGLVPHLEKRLNNT